MKIALDILKVMKSIFCPSSQLSITEYEDQLLGIHTIHDAALNLLEIVSKLPLTENKKIPMILFPMQCTSVINFELIPDGKKTK